MLKSKRLAQYVELALDPRAVKGLFTWPTFSVTSYQMVSGLVRQGISPATIIDVGANVGQFAVAAGKLIADVEIHSFEPVPDCYAELRRRVGGLGNIKTYPIALGDSPGTAPLNLNSHSHSSSLLALSDHHRGAFPEARETSTVAVEVSTLDRVFEGQQLKPKVLLKLDVQGYEARVLAGGRRTLERVDYIVLEASFKPLYKGESLFLELVRMLDEQGFAFRRPVGWLADPSSGEFLQMDALFEPVGKTGPA